MRAVACRWRLDSLSPRSIKCDRLENTVATHLSHTKNKPFRGNRSAVSGNNDRPSNVVGCATGIKRVLEGEVIAGDWGREVDGRLPVKQEHVAALDSIGRRAIAGLGEIPHHVGVRI